MKKVIGKVTTYIGTEHAYLTPDPAVVQTILDGIPETERKAHLEGIRERASAAEPKTLTKQGEEQNHLDHLTNLALGRAGVDTTRDGLSFFGLVPAAPALHAWVTHPFFHAGWTVLLVNLLLLGFGFRTYG